MSSHANLYRRITASVPLLVTVIVHIVLIAIAGYFVVSEQIIGKKKIMEAAAASAPSAAEKQVEHRLQVARKGGGSASSSPVSASRIFSTAENALQMPAMPDLPSVGASSLSGMGFGAGMGAVGTGTGYNTGIGNSGTLGRGFMSMSFLGVTNQRASKVVFIVDIGPGLMDIRKGGFRAFEILRNEISRLINTLPPSNEFNVILFDGQINSIRLFAPALTPATVANKTAFFEWIKPINSSLSNLGGKSIPASSPKWTFKRDEKLKLDPDFWPAHWIQGIHAALELKPDTLFVITGGGGAGQIRYSDESIARRRAQREQEIARLKASGVDIAGISAARNKAFGKLQAEFNEINRKLIAQKKDPFVITNIRRVLDGDFQAALKRAGFTLKLDPTGWTDKEGNLIWTDFSTNVATSHNAEFNDAVFHISKLQYGLVPERAALNIFLFTGPGEKTEGTEKNLSSLTSKNGGKFNLLTTKRLEELSKRNEEEK